MRASAPVSSSSASSSAAAGPVSAARGARSCAASSACPASARRQSPARAPARCSTCARASPRPAAAAHSAGVPAVPRRQHVRVACTTIYTVHCLAGPLRPWLRRSSCRSQQHRCILSSTAVTLTCKAGPRDRLLMLRGSAGACKQKHAPGRSATSRAQRSLAGESDVPAVQTPATTRHAPARDSTSAGSLTRQKKHRSRRKALFTARASLQGAPRPPQACFLASGSCVMHGTGVLRCQQVCLHSTSCSAGGAGALLTCRRAPRSSHTECATRRGPRCAALRHCAGRARRPAASKETRRLQT